MERLEVVLKYFTSKGRSHSINNSLHNCPLKTQTGSFKTVRSYTNLKRREI